MTKQIINIGSGPLAGDGEGLYSAFDKINQNFGEVYAATSNIPTDVSQLTDNTNRIAMAYTLPQATSSTLGGVKIGSNINIDSNGVISVAAIPTNVSAFFNDAGYLTTSNFNNLGNLTIVDQTITGNDVNGDIVINPNGSGYLSTNGVKIPAGTLISDTSQIVANIANLTLAAVIDHSSTTALTVGQYGIPNGIIAPWTVYSFTTTPSPILQVGDIIAGAGIPTNSTVVYVGSNSYATYVIVNTDFGTATAPAAGTTVTTARSIVNAGLSIQTPANTDITLNAGPGGNIVPHNDILPYTTDQWRLGSPARRFREIWLGAGTIYVLDETLGTDIAIGARDGNLYVQGGDGLQVGNFLFNGNKIGLVDTSQDILLGSIEATGSFIINRSTTVNSGNFTVISTAFGANDSPLKIYGSGQSGTPLSNAGTLTHWINQTGQSARLIVDAYGAGTYNVIAGRMARGTVSAPSATQIGDTLMRIAGNGYGATGFNSLGVGNISVVAAENYTDSAKGSKIAINLTPVGTNTIQDNTLTIDTTGITLLQGGSGGITWSDGTRQTTAWTGSVSANQITGNVVTSITAGTGLYQSGTTGNITMNATGVQNVYGTQAQIYVTDAGNKNLTLSLPQNIDSTANPTFNNLTVNNLTVNGTSTVNTSSTIAGKILYLATGSTGASQIDGGGIILGASPFAQQILYNLTNNYWDLGTAGIKVASEVDTGSLSANTISVSNTARFGTAYVGSAYPNAFLQIDENANSYVQLVQQNHSNGTNASTDFVASNDLGDDSSYFIDMGINSSTYNGTSVGWTVSGANDAYLYNANGNLTIGTSTAGAVIKFHTGGTLSTNIRAIISDTGLNVAGSVTATGFTGSVYGNVIGNVTGNVTGNVSGNAGTVTHGVYTTDTGTVTNLMLAGSITNGKLTNSSVTVTAGSGLSGGGTVSLGGSIILTNADGGSQQNIFKNVFVTGQGTITAISNNDTLTFTAGSGVSMTTAGSTITVSSTVPIGYTGSRGYLGSAGAAGAVGYTGSFGSIGYTGSQGPQGMQGVGFTGSQGIQGISGYTGSFGVAGYTGSIGFTGYAGSVGYAGSQGPQGAQGTNTTLKGSVATVGALPASGNTVGDGYIVIASGHLYVWSGAAWTDVGAIVGPTGYTGSGYAGSQGTIGYTGSLGAVGYVGSQGNLGFVGSFGFTGSYGYTGSQGYWGSFGYTGSQGTVGYAGSQGNIGYTGSVGPNIAATTSTLGSVIVSTGLAVTGGGTLTNAGVTSAVAGLGIGVSSGTGNVTITNNGVLAVNGYTGSVTGIITSNDTGTVTNAMLAGSIANSKLTNSSVTIGSTSISLGATSTILGGLTSVSATTFTGNLTGNVTGNVSGTAASITGTYSGSLSSSQVTTALGFTPLQTAVTSLAGTANQISVSASTGSVTISLPSAVTFPGPVTLSAGTNSVDPLTFVAGSNLTSASAGATEYDGKALYFTPQGAQRGILPSLQYYVLNANYSLANQSSTQSLLGVGVTLSSGTRYQYRILCTIYASSGVRTSSGIQYALAGTATLAQHTYIVNPACSSGQTTPTQVYQMSNHITTGFTTLVTVSNSISGTAYYNLIIDGSIDVTTGGTVIPQLGFSNSQTPGSSSYVQAGATIEIWPIGASGANTSVGTWA